MIRFPFQPLSQKSLASDLPVGRAHKDKDFSLNLVNSHSRSQSYGSNSTHLNRLLGVFFFIEK